MQQPFRNKNDLLKWLEENAPRKAIANAMVEGKIEFLGAFLPAPGSSIKPGWVIKITSKRNMIWNVAIVINKYKRNYNSYTVKNIYWKNYRGGNTPLFAGDNHIEYERLKNEEIIM